MKRKHLFSMGVASTALLMSGAALADPPAGHSWNNWTATAGNIDLNTCTPPACLTLLDETGMLQALVTDTAGDTFIQTINVEDGFTGAPAGADFRNEAFVDTVSGGFDVAALTFVDLDGQGVMQSEIASDNLQGPGELFLDLWQSNTLSGLGTIEFWFGRLDRSGAQFSTNTNAGASMRMDFMVDNPAGTRVTPLTVRKTSGAFTTDSGTLELVDGQTITYSQGDHLHTVFMTGRLWNGGPMHMPTDQYRVFENQAIANYTTGEAANWANANNEIAAAPRGYGWVSFEAVWGDEFAGNSNLWNGNFGTAPVTVSSGTSPDFSVLENGGAFPDFPSHTNP